MSRSATISPVMRSFTRYVAGALSRRLPPAVAHRAKLSLIDTVATLIAGSRLQAGKCAIAYVKSLHGKPEAAVIGTRIVTTAVNASLANGTFGHADETDDTHTSTRSHPGCSVVPAALAIAERQASSGHRLLRAMVLGYDVCARIVLALRPAAFLMRCPHHLGGHGQLFGAAAASAALLGLDADRIRYVLAYCVQQASGVTTLFRDTSHVEKAYAAGGMQAHNGAAAALMVAHGFNGVEDVFYGDPDYFSIFSPKADPQALVRGLGREYEIMNASIKRWPAGAPIQGPLHVLHELIEQHKIRPQDVAKLVAKLPDRELWVVNNREMSGISLQHLLAVMLIDGTVSFAAAHDATRMRDPRVIALRKRIAAVGDASLTDPLRRWRCVMELTLKNGLKLVHRTMAAKGMYENPLTRQEVEEKALGLIAPVLGARRSRELMAALYNIEKVRNVRSLRKLYVATAR